MACFNISMVRTAAFLKIPTIGFGELFLLSLFSPAVQPPSRDSACSAVSSAYEDVQPIAKALKEAAPVELRTNEADAQAKAWPVWVARHGRLAQGAHETGGRKTRWQTLSAPSQFFQLTAPIHTIGHRIPCQKSF